MNLPVLVLVALLGCTWESQYILWNSTTGTVLVSYVFVPSYSSPDCGPRIGEYAPVGRFQSGGFVRDARRAAHREDDDGEHRQRITLQLPAGAALIVCSSSNDPFDSPPPIESIQVRGGQSIAVLDSSVALNAAFQATTFPRRMWKFED